MIYKITTTRVFETENISHAQAVLNDIAIGCGDTEYLDVEDLLLLAGEKTVEQIDVEESDWVCGSRVVTTVKVDATGGKL